MTTRNIAAFTITFILLFASLTPVYADIAPPKPPPSSGINPTQETKVQMVAENVLMVVKEISPDVYVIEVTADFAMKNLGESDEQMQVRFPLENISGRGDHAGQHPEIRDFRVSVNKISVNTKNVQESYQTNGIPLNWAVFDVNFPVGDDVYIRVSYVTDVQEYASPTIEYILGTGSGWYKTIGTAAITLRFPYAVSMANILWFQHPDNVPDNAVLIGKEIRWHWTNYEPLPNEIVSVSVVHPIDWQKIIDLELYVGNNPHDIEATIDLSQEYLKAGSEKLYVPTQNLATLAEITIKQTLALYPNDVRLHLTLLEAYQQHSLFFYGEANNPYMSKMYDEVNVILSLDPANQRALDLKHSLEQDFENTPIPTTLIVPTVTVALTSTVTPPTIEPVQTQIINTTEPLPTKTLRADENENNSNNSIFIGALLLLSGFIMGTIFVKLKNRA